MMAGAPDGKPGLRVHYRSFDFTAWTVRAPGVGGPLICHVSARDARDRPAAEAAAVRLLVTGGAGYIGSIVARPLLACGHEVARLDDRPQPRTPSRRPRRRRTRGR
jgi:hypothetical protein